MFSPQYFDQQQQQQQVTITYPYSSPSLEQQNVTHDNTFKECESSNFSWGFYAKFNSWEFTFNKFFRVLNRDLINLYV